MLNKEGCIPIYNYLVYEKIIFMVINLIRSEAIIHEGCS